MDDTLILNACVINEGTQKYCDITVREGRINRIGSDFQSCKAHRVVDAAGLCLMPGMIDDQVHFREPGMTAKGDIVTESAAAVAGGITSYMEMPNVDPATTTLDALMRKYGRAQGRSLANYAFYFGATNTNIDEIRALDPSVVCGVKVFMGASTGDLLVDDPQALELIFRDSPVLIATHCEDGRHISANAERILRRYPDEIPAAVHPLIRDADACYASSSLAVELARHHGSDLHVLHITTAKELSLFTPGPVGTKRITAEACVHHLWFTDQDYSRLGNRIKCNPAIKTVTDRVALLEAVRDGRIDVIATDHAPHLLSEKLQPYPQAPAGLPLVEHALPVLFELYHEGKLTLESIVEQVSHNPALRYRVKERGFIREGYWADMVLVDLAGGTTVGQHVRYKCGWSPFAGQRFRAKIAGTWVNGIEVYDGCRVLSHPRAAQQLQFERVV